MKLICLVPLLALAACVTPTQEPARDAPREKPVTGLTVGTYDSRAIAVAHARSETFTTYLSEQFEDLRRALDRARAAGDEEFAEVLEALGPEKQRGLHERAFGTAPVDDLIESLAEHLPELAREQGVDLIVNRWQITWQDPDVELVDVTEALVEVYEPTPETRRIVRELIASEPVEGPLDEH